MNTRGKLFLLAAGLFGFAVILKAITTQAWTILGGIVACLALVAAGILVGTRRD